MKKRAVPLLALVGLFGCGLCDLGAAQSAIGGPKKPVAIGGPVKPAVVGGPAKSAVVATPMKSPGPIVAASKSTLAAVPELPQAKCTGPCDAKGVHH